MPWSLGPYECIWCKQTPCVDVTTYDIMCVDTTCNRPRIHNNHLSWCGNVGVPYTFLAIIGQNASVFNSDRYMLRSSGFFLEEPEVHIPQTPPTCWVNFPKVSNFNRAHLQLAVDPPHFIRWHELGVELESSYKHLLRHQIQPNYVIFQVLVIGAKIWALEIKEACQIRLLNRMKHLYLAR